MILVSRRYLEAYNSGTDVFHTISLIGTTTANFVHFIMSYF